MAGSFDVLCAGIIVVDHIAAPVDHLPAAGELVLTDECFLTIGGCASNVAVALQRLGRSTAVCGKVGKDSFGTFAADVLSSHGVDTGYLRFAESVATSQTLILNVQGQDRRFIHHLGANQKFIADDFPSDLLAHVKVLYLGGYFLMDGLLPRDVAEIFAKAQARGIKTVLDVVVPGPKPYVEALTQILPYTDVFLPNDDEAKAMTGLDDPLEQAKMFRKLGAKTAVITLGGRGAVLSSESVTVKAGAFDVEFIDGTGGGDAFDAGFIEGLLQGASVQECLSLGSALGASCVRRSGATAGVFNRQELDEFLRTQRLAITDL